MIGFANKNWRIDINNKVMKKLLILLFAVITAMSVTAQEIEGSWTGKLDLGAMSLNLVLNFTKTADGKLACTLDSPDQGAKGIAAEVESSDSAKFKVTVSAINASYEGTLTDGELHGTFTQNGYSFPLTMKPGELKRNRPQEPQPPYPYATEEVSFNNSSAATLVGTLTLPVDYDAKKPVPVVIMVTGSGFQNRDEEVFGHKPFLVIADYLARCGIASLRYDDRGYAKSTGDFAQATTEDFMQDAAAGIAWLRSRGKQFSKVGVIGHSEGATIAFMLAEREKADFIVSLAAPGVKGDTILAGQTNLQLERQGVAQRVSAQDIRKQVAAHGDVWQKHFIDYDPASAIAATHCPVMAINGTKDTQVTPELNFTVIERLLPKSKKNLLKKYEGLNHLFQHCTTGYVDEYAQIEDTISPEVLSDIAEWINSVTK